MIPYWIKIHIGEDEDSTESSSVEKIGSILESTCECLVEEIYDSLRGLGFLDEGINEAMMKIVKQRGKTQV